MVDGKPVLPPRELVLMWEYRDFQTLPRLGGLWNQPAGLLARMRYAERVFQVFDTFNRAGSKKTWDEEHPGLLKFKLDIDKLRESDV